MNAEPQQKLVFIGLGNPGKKYANTRHNLGFLVLEQFARSLGWAWREEKRFNAYVVNERLDDKNVHLLMPLTYMNESGSAVKRYLDYYKLSTSQIVVVSDEIAFPFGELRLRSHGSSGGHNGLKSIAAWTGTDNFVRLRMGIGSKLEGTALADYVLGDFTITETVALDEFVKRGSAILKLLTTETVATVMNRVNTKLTL